jgi:hypothetical protein
MVTSETRSLKNHREAYFSVCDYFLSIIQVDKIREKQEEIKDSFPVEAEKLELFLGHYDRVNFLKYYFFVFLFEKK